MAMEPRAVGLMRAASPEGYRQMSPAWLGKKLPACGNFIAGCPSLSLFAGLRLSAFRCNEFGIPLPHTVNTANSSTSSANCYFPHNYIDVAILQVVCCQSIGGYNFTGFRVAWGR